jgi:hypothetical protein
MEEEIKTMPPLPPEGQVRLEVLMELLMTFAKYVNDTKGIVPDYKFADFVIYAMGKRLEEYTENEKCKKK